MACKHAHEQFNEFLSGLSSHGAYNRHVLAPGAVNPPKSGAFKTDYPTRPNQVCESGIQSVQSGGGGRSGGVSHAANFVPPSDLIVSALDVDQRIFPVIARLLEEGADGACFFVRFSIPLASELLPLLYRGLAGHHGSTSWDVTDILSLTTLKSRHLHPGKLLRRRPASPSWPPRSTTATPPGGSFLRRPCPVIEVLFQGKDFEGPLQRLDVSHFGLCR